MTVHFEWKNDFSVGEETIDSQHKKLLDQVNKILDVVVFGVEAKIVEDNIMNFLEEYIKEHFLYEEEYMRKIKYPYIKKHRQEHRSFVKNYIKFKKELEMGVDKSKLILKVENFLGTWLLNHIGKEDKKYYLFNEGQKGK